MEPFTERPARNWLQRAARQHGGAAQVLLLRLLEQHGLLQRAAVAGRLQLQLLLQREVAGGGG